VTDELDLGSAFADRKAPEAMRTIGEVAQALGIKQHVLRYWEQQFTSLRPLKRSGGRRYYRSEDVALVRRIDQLVNREGYTIKGARQALEVSAPVASEEEPRAPSQAAASDLDRDELGAASPRLLPALMEIRSRLAHALQNA